MFLSFYITGAKPWQHYVLADAKLGGDNFIALVFNHLATWGLPLIMVIIGVIEFAYGFMKMLMQAIRSLTGMRFKKCCLLNPFKK